MAAVTKHTCLTEEDIFIVEVLQSVVSAMKVPVYPATIPETYITLNYEPGRTGQIIDALFALDYASLGSLKYPLIAVVMPIPENSGSGFSEVTFPRIVIANLTKTNTGTELVLDKYAASGVLKTILRPCVKEFIKQLAWSTYTNHGDREAYEYTVKEQLCPQIVGEGLNDYVDIIEILNLKVTFFKTIKS